MAYEVLMDMRVSPGTRERVREMAERKNMFMSDVWRELLDALPGVGELSEVAKPKTDERVKTTYRCTQQQRKNLGMAKVLNDCSTAELFESVDVEALLDDEVNSDD